MILLNSNALDKRVLKLIENDEKHDKESIVSSLDLLKEAKKRFLLMQNILKPLVDSLSKEIIITNAYFTVELDGAFSINISYIKENKPGMLILCQLEYDQLELVFGSHDSQIDNLILNQKKRILDIFSQGLDESFDRQGEIIDSTSGLFSLSISNKNFELYNNDDSKDKGKNFNILIKFLPESLKISSVYQSLEEKFKKEENVNSFLEHVKVYEKNIPFYLNNKK